MFREGIGLFGTLAALRSQMQTGLMCASLVARGSSLMEIQKALPKLKGRQLERMIELARGYGEGRFRSGLLKLGELERRAKNQMLPERLALELTVTELAAV